MTSGNDRLAVLLRAAAAVEDSEPGWEVDVPTQVRRVHDRFQRKPAAGITVVPSGPEHDTAIEELAGQTTELTSSRPMPEVRLEAVDPPAWWRDSGAAAWLWRSPGIPNRVAVRVEGAPAAWCFRLEWLGLRGEAPPEAPESPRRDHCWSERVTEWIAAPDNEVLTGWLALHVLGAAQGYLGSVLLRAAQTSAPVGTS
jgi:hypothetical protein